MDALDHKIIALLSIDARAPLAQVAKEIGELGFNVATLRTLITSDAVLREALSADGVVATSSSPEELGAYIRSESEKWAKVIRDAGIEPR